MHFIWAVGNSTKTAGGEYEIIEKYKCQNFLSKKFHDCIHQIKWTKEKVIDISKTDSEYKLDWRIKL